MTGHLWRQAALLSRALNACVHIALDAYMCESIEPSYDRRSIVLSIAREDILWKICIILRQGILITLIYIARNNILP